MEKANNTAAVTLDELESMDVEAFAAAQEQPEGTHEWRIADDSAADWALRKIATERAELERIKALAEEQIARIEERTAAAEKRYQNATDFLTYKLAEYFETVPQKKTKTTASYRLLSGTLKKKLGGQQMKQDDEKLLAYLKATGSEDMIQTTEKPRWGEYKKQLELWTAELSTKTPAKLWTVWKSSKSPTPSLLSPWTYRR